MSKYAGAIAIVNDGMPDDDEIAVCIRIQSRLSLDVIRSRVDLEFASRRISRGVEESAVYSVVAAVLPVGFPDGDGISRRIDRNFREPLCVGRIGIPESFAGQRLEIIIIASAENAVTVSVLRVGGPADYDIAVFA